MRAICIAITPTIVHLTTIWINRIGTTCFHDILSPLSRSSLTDASGIRSGTCVCVSNLASTYNRIALSIVWADSVSVTTTILHLTTICESQIDRHHSASSEVSWAMDAYRSSLPVHDTPAPEAVLLKPVLHLHFTAFVVASCEQSALASHPPLPTWQASENDMTTSANDQSELKVITRAHDARTIASVGISSLAGAYDCIAGSIVWTCRIGITSSIAHQTGVYEARKNEDGCMTRLNARHDALTRASDVCCRACVGITSLANADDCVGCSIMRTDCIGITSTVLYLTGLYTK